MSRKNRYVGLLAPVELFCTFDWAAWFAPHVNPIGGFATSYDCSGMHLFELARDRDGHVRLHMAKSSQALTMLPEGKGVHSAAWMALPSVPSTHRHIPYLYL